jgi:hypothetical protein
MEEMREKRWERRPAGNRIWRIKADERILCWNTNPDSQCVPCSSRERPHMQRAKREKWEKRKMQGCAILPIRVNDGR